MRKDLFLTGTRFIGLWQLAASLISLAYIVSEYIGYTHPQGYSHEYSILRFVIEFLVGLYFLIRPETILKGVQFFALNEDVGQPITRERKELRSKVK